MTTAIVETKKDLKENILYNLKHGQQNAIKKVELARRCGVHERGLRLAIRDLIDDGHPICGSPHPPYGYFIAETAEEIQAELNLLRNGYGMELLRRYSTLKRIKVSFVLLHPGQLPLGI